MLLQVLHSPFIYGGEVNEFQLLTALGICRLKYRESKVRRPFRPFSKLLLRKCVDKFMAYIGDYTTRPEYNIVPIDFGSQTKDIAPPKFANPPPDVVMLAYDAAQGARVTIKEAWNMPLAEAFISQAMYYRYQGSQLDFMDDEERKFQEAMKKAGIE